MAKETVQAVRQAELSAAQIEKNAIVKQDEILTGAQQKAKEILKSTTKEAQKKAELELQEAEKTGAELVEAAKVRAEKEILLMKEMTKSKEQAAINLILSEVI